jgi:hypothetical protein
MGIVAWLNEAIRRKQGAAGGVSAPSRADFMRPSWTVPVDLPLLMFLLSDNAFAFFALADGTKQDEVGFPST